MDVTDLKTLYSELVDFSLKEPSYCSSSSESASNRSKIEHCNVAAKGYLPAICDYLYKKLHEWIETLLSSQSSDSYSRKKFSGEQIYLLLRCCLVVLNLIGSNLNILLEKCKFLLEVLGRIRQFVLVAECGREAIFFEKSEALIAYPSKALLKEDYYASVYFIRQPNRSLPILRKLLEVYLDELLVHRRLWQHFLFVSYRSSSNKGLLVNTRSGNTGNLLEICATHFLASIYSEKSLEQFLSDLFCLYGSCIGFNELGAIASASLLHIPMVFSSPKLLQAYLISSVSEAFGTEFRSPGTKPDLGIIGCCLSAFERSVILYRKHIFVLEPSFESPKSINQFLPSFDSYVQSETKNMIHTVMSELNSSWNLHKFRKTKVELLESSLAFLQKTKGLSDKGSRDDISSLLHLIIHEAFSYGTNRLAMEEYIEADPHDIFLLTAIVKLMSRTLWQIALYLRNFESSREYDCLKDAMGCFKQFEACLPVQKLLSDAMRGQIDVNTDLFAMLLHFSGLVSLSFTTGFEFLVNGSVLILVGLMNLFAVEYGGFDCWTALLNPKMELHDWRKSSLLIASRFQEIQMSLPCSGSASVEVSRRGSEEIAESSGTDEQKTCNGEVFLKCVAGNNGKVADIEDLSDFIECKEGKDYSAWLNNKQKYRKRKNEKLAVLKWRKMKRAWKEIKSNGS